MSWNPNQGQDPNQPVQYGGYNPPSQPQPPNPYGDPQSGYGQQGGYGQQPGGYQQPGYQQQQPSGYQQPGGYQQGPYGTPPYGAQSPSGPTSMGLQPNIAAGLSYVLGWVTGLIFFLVEKQNRFVRFHAMQSILFFGGLTVVQIILNVIGNFPFVGIFTGLIGVAVGIIGLVGYIVLLINAFQGKYFKLPIVGDYAERYANQGM